MAGERKSGPSSGRRRGAAAVELAFSLPLLVTVVFGMLEVGRITQVQQVLWNGAREAARDASIGQDNLQTVATNLAAYLQAAEPTAFGKGDTISLIAPVMTLPANATGYTCWDTKANRELFTVWFLDTTNTNVTDPSLMYQLDRFQIALQVPYAGIKLTRVLPVATDTRMGVTVTWTSMVDAPFQIAPDLPAE